MCFVLCFRYAFLAFGQGPRNCMGMRFALLEVKYALALIMAKFNFRATEDTVRTITLDPRSQLAAPAQPLIVKVSKREDSKLME